MAIWDVPLFRPSGFKDTVFFYRGGWRNIVAKRLIDHSNPHSDRTGLNHIPASMCVNGEIHVF